MNYSLFTFIVTLFSSSLLAQSSFEYTGIPIKTLNAEGKPIKIIIKRDIPLICQKLKMNNEMIWSGDYAHSKVPKTCKSTYVHTKGKLLPMHLHEDIDTYGELEVLAFIKEMQTDDSLQLIDGRKQEWFDYRTIPSAINMPFHHFKEKESFEFEFEHHLIQLGVIIKEHTPKEKFNFKTAKTIAIFCNGAWCSQSVAMINALLEIGYPPEKIKWYRGGMQSWLGAGMTSTRK